MPQFDATTFPSQLFWLVVSFALLYLLLTRIALPRISSVLEDRQRRISGDLEKAESLRVEAEEVLGEYEKAIAETRAKAQELTRQAKDESAAEAQARQDELARQTAEKGEAAEARIAEARKEALANIAEVAADVAAAATQHLVDIDVDRKAAAGAVAAVQDERG